LRAQTKSSVQTKITDWLRKQLASIRKLCIYHVYNKEVTVFIFFRLSVSDIFRVIRASQLSVLVNYPCFSIIRSQLTVLLNYPCFSIIRASQLSVLLNHPCFSIIRSSQISVDAAITMDNQGYTT